jgi:WhiB family redox-sensing transcriptional regulator
MAYNWRLRAACLGQDTDQWFPEGNEPLAIAAKLVCARCPVADECLSWAQANGEIWGIWGGLDEDERRVLRHTDVLVLAGG